MTNAEKAYWKELNEMYGLDLEMPKEIKLDMSAVHYDMAMGSGFDDAVQRNLEVR